MRIPYMLDRSDWVRHGVHKGRCFGLRLRRNIKIPRSRKFRHNNLVCYSYQHITEHPIRRLLPVSLLPGSLCYMNPPLPPFLCTSFFIPCYLYHIFSEIRLIFSSNILSNHGDAVPSEHNYPDMLLQNLIAGGNGPPMTKGLRGFPTFLGCRTTIYIAPGPT